MFLACSLADKANIKLVQISFLEVLVIVSLFKFLRIWKATNKWMRSHHFSMVQTVSQRNITFVDKVHCGIHASELSREESVRGDAWLELQYLG